MDVPQTPQTPQMLAPLMPLIPLTGFNRLDLAQPLIPLASLTEIRQQNNQAQELPTLAPLNGFYQQNNQAQPPLIMPIMGVPNLSLSSIPIIGSRFGSFNMTRIFPNGDSKNDKNDKNDSKTDTKHKSDTKTPITFTGKISYFNKLLPTDKHVLFAKFMQNSKERHVSQNNSNEIGSHHPACYCVFNYRSCLKTFNFIKSEFAGSNLKFGEIKDPFELFPGPSIGWFNLCHILNGRYEESQMYDLLNILFGSQDAEIFEMILNDTISRVHHLKRAISLMDEDENEWHMISNLIDYYKFKISLLEAKLDKDR